MDSLVLFAAIGSVFMTVLGAISMRQHAPLYMRVCNAGVGAASLMSAWLMLWADFEVVKNMHPVSVFVRPGEIHAVVEGEKVRLRCCPISAIGLVYPTRGGKPITADLTFMASKTSELKCRPPGEQSFGEWVWRFDPAITPSAFDAYVTHKCDGSPWPVRDSLGPWKIITQ